MYQQIASAVERFQDDEHVKECLHLNDTNINESLNMSVSRLVPKFKHFGTTMALDSRVRLVLGVHNLGYAEFYLTLLHNLGCLDEMAIQQPISTSITRLSTRKMYMGTKKKTVEYKRRRKHGREAKTKQQLYEEGIDRAKNLGTYATGIGIGFGIQNQDEDQNKQQSTTTGGNVCPRCNRPGHKTWKAKACADHPLFVIHMAQKRKKNEETQNTHFDNTKETDRMVSGDVDVAISAGVGAGVGGVGEGTQMVCLPVSETDRSLSQNKKKLYVVVNDKASICEKNEKVKESKSHVSQAHDIPSSTSLTQKDLIVECGRSNTIQIQSLPSSTCMSKPSTICTGNVENVRDSTSVHLTVPEEIDTRKRTGIKKAEDKNSHTGQYRYVEESVQYFQNELIYQKDSDSINSENSEISFISKEASV